MSKETEGTDLAGVTADELRQFIERFEQLEAGLALFLHDDESPEDMKTLLPSLEKANRQIDAVIREAAALQSDARQARTVSKVILIQKLEALEQKARDCERTLELLTRDARIEEERQK